jgi:hypothetical protein
MKLQSLPCQRKLHPQVLHEGVLCAVHRLLAIPVSLMCNFEANVLHA